MLGLLGEDEMIDRIGTRRSRDHRRGDVVQRLERPEFLAFLKVDLAIAARGFLANARELEDALAELSRFDEGPDLVLYYKHLLVLLGNHKYELHFNQEDRLSPSQQTFAETQLKLFQKWWSNWSGKSYRT